MINIVFIVEQLHCHQAGYGPRQSRDANSAEPSSMKHVALFHPAPVRTNGLPFTEINEIPRWLS